MPHTVDTLNRQIALDEKAAVTRLAAEYLSIICDPEIVMLMPGVAEHIYDQSDEMKEAIVHELVAAHAIEQVAGTYTATPEGRSINAKLAAAAMTNRVR